MLKSLRKKSEKTRNAIAGGLSFIIVITFAYFYMIEDLSNNFNFNKEEITEKIEIAKENTGYLQEQSGPISDIKDQFVNIKNLFKK